MPVKKTICFVLPVHSSHTIGGAQFQAECLMKYIINLDKFKVYYITNSSCSDYHPTDYSLVHLDTNYHKRTTFSLIKSYKALLGTLQKIKPDIIYQRIGCYQTAVCSHYAKSNECLTLCHIASDRDVTPIRIFNKDRNFLFKLLDKKMQEYGLRNATKIIAQTNTQAEALKVKFNRIANSVVYNFHPIPQNHTVKEPPAKVMWVANLKNNKRPELFIRLANELHLMTGAKFIMVGKMQGSIKWCDRIKRDIRNTKGLEYLGSVSQETVNDLLNQSHLLVNTSRFEGFSNTFIQAWMRKVPVISLNVDPDSLLQTRQLGRLSGGYDRLKQDVKELIEKDALRETIGENAYEYSIKYHSFENIKKIVDLMEK